MNPGRIVKDRSTGWDANPRRRVTGAESSPLDDQCQLSVGPDGLEPSPTWLRARHAAANTLIPKPSFVCSFRAHNRRGGSRTLDLVLIRDLLSPLSYAPVGPKGVEPLPFRLKGGCAAVTPQPQNRSVRMRLSRDALVMCFLLSKVVVRGGVEPPPATYQIAMLPLQHRTVGKAGVEPAISWSQGTRGAVPLPPVRFVHEVSSSYGSRTHLSALKGRDPRTDRRTSRVVFCAR